jgi:rhodanese-related sulfurtransferase
MKKFLVLMIVVLIPFTVFSNGNDEAVAGNTVADAAAEYFADYPGSRIVPASTVFEAIDGGEDFLILDIRRAADYEAGHIKGAVNAAWGSPALAETLNWLPDDKPVYVNCYTGQTAGQTVAVLNVAGFQASSIKYGWNLGISKTEGYEGYVETKVNASPEPSGVKIDAAVKKAAADYFNATSSSSNIITSANLKEMLDNDEKMTIVSIRQPADFAKGHIEGAQNIPFGEGMQTALAGLPTDQPVYVYCYSGQTAGQTVGIMRLMGIDAMSVKSGMGTPVTTPSGWSNEGFPVVQ